MQRVMARPTISPPKKCAGDECELNISSEVEGMTAEQAAQIAAARRCGVRVLMEKI
jgi:hypothetical protein